MTTEVCRRMKSTSEIYWPLEFSTKYTFVDDISHIFHPQRVGTNILVTLIEGSLQKEDFYFFHFVRPLTTLHREQIQLPVAHSLSTFYGEAQTKWEVDFRIIFLKIYIFEKVFFDWLVAVGNSCCCFFSNMCQKNHAHISFYWQFNETLFFSSLFLLHSSDQHFYYLRWLTTTASWERCNGNLNNELYPMNACDRIENNFTRKVTELHEMI